MNFVLDDVVEIGIVSHGRQGFLGSTEEIGQIV